MQHTSKDFEASDPHTAKDKRRKRQAAQLITYEYDNDGIMVSKTVNGVKTRYVVDKNRDYPVVLEERNESGELLVSYQYGDDLISQNRGGEVRYFHYDGQMSTRQLTDTDGIVTDTYTYDAFGNILYRTGSSENNYLYSGERFDPNTGFYNLRARWMSPENGRFLKFYEDEWWYSDSMAIVSETESYEHYFEAAQFYPLHVMRIPTGINLSNAQSMMRRLKTCD